MRRWPTVRSWAAMHATGPASTIMALVALASMVFDQTLLSGFGFILFADPISAQLVLPAFAGVAAAIACDNAARLSLPDPTRAVLARAAWAVGWTMLAVLASNVGQFTEATANWDAVARNAVIYTGLGMLCVLLRYPHLAWLPVLVLTTGSMVFGQTVMGGYYWWAVVLEGDLTSAQVALIGPLIVGIILGYVLLPPRGRNAYR